MKNKLAKIFIIITSIISATAIWKCYKNEKNEVTSVGADRFEIGFQIFNKWLKLKNQGKSLKPYFEDNDLKTVAIYGVGGLGERLFEDLKSLDINVIYAIDRVAGMKHIEGLHIVGIEDELKDVDAIIVTPVQDFYAIEKVLEEKTDSEIISLEDIVNYCI